MANSGGADAGTPLISVGVVKRTRIRGGADARGERSATRRSVWNCSSAAEPPEKALSEASAGAERRGIAGKHRQVDEEGFARLEYRGVEMAGVEDERPRRMPEAARAFVANRSEQLRLESEAEQAAQGVGRLRRETQAARRTEDRPAGREREVEIRSHPFNQLERETNTSGRTWPAALSGVR